MTRNKVILAILVFSALGIYLFYSLDIMRVNVDYIVEQGRGYSRLAPLFMFLLAFIQGIFPLLPFFLVAGAGGILLGPEVGFLIIWLGTLASTVLLFFLGRFLGKEAIEGWLEKRGYHWRYTEEKGFWVLLLARIFPLFIPSAVYSLLGGVSRIRFSTYIIASGLGAMPWTFVYTSTGNNLYVGQSFFSKEVIWLLVVVVALIVIRGVIYLKQKGEG